MWLAHSARLHLQVIVSQRYMLPLGLGWGCMPITPLGAGTLPGLDTRRLCAHCQSLCVLMCVSAVLCLEDVVSLVSSKPSGFYGILCL